MFTDFFYFLRSSGLKISLNEWMSLLQALQLGLHDSSLTGFYHLARMILVKSETEFDRFDRAFLTFFKEVESFTDLPDDIKKWLETPVQPKEYDRLEVDALFAGLDLAEIRRMLEERLQEQHERHDGGKKWVGTGGVSPFGRDGYNPNGFRFGGEGRHQSALQVAAERHYQDFRRDAALDTRQFQMAFRKLRRLSTRNEGPKDQLQLEETIQATCENAGHLKLEFGRKRTNDVRLLLLFDAGGSMWSYTQMCSQLFRAAHQSNRFKELRTYYFHNCVYDDLSFSSRYWDGNGIPTEELIRSLNSEWKVLFVGDGAMSVSELTDKGGCIDYYTYNRQPGIYFLRQFAAHFPHTAWLNPIAKDNWPYVRGCTTIRMIDEVIPMFPLSLEGLDGALKRLLVSR